MDNTVISAPTEKVAIQTPKTPRRGGLSIVEMLIESALLSKEQVAMAQEGAKRDGLPVWMALVRDGLVRSQDVAAIAALHSGLPMVDLRNQLIEPQALALIPESLARKYAVLPVKASAERLTVAMADPTDLRLLQDLAARTGRVIEPIVATPDDILQQIDLSYRLVEVGLGDNTGQGTGEARDEGGPLQLQDAPPAQVIDLLVKQAVQDRASDIHISPTETRLRIRFRIDGILHDVKNLPLQMHPTIISRLKIMAGMNVAERRRAQDGQFSVEFPNRKVDIRVAVSSTVSGEMAVLRLLDKGFTLLSLDNLGMGTKALEQFRQLLSLPYGMVVACGPTGSGKSTTLYASLLQMNRAERNCISLEDPVEYHIGDMNQMQVHVEAGVTFATQLRSVLRLDPDVILVGEIRDQETATIATQASLTGHLVITSLHANDSVAALIRLRDLGVAPYLIASSLAGVVSQRMVRQVCSNCQAVTTRPIVEQKAYTSVLGEVQEHFVYGTGCNVCAQTGYRGRTGVFEVLTMTDTIRRLFLADASRDELREQALKDGLVPLQREGMLKAKGGVTTPYEVMRVLFSLD